MCMLEDTKMLIALVFSVGSTEASSGETAALLLCGFVIKVTKGRIFVQLKYQ